MNLWIKDLDLLLESILKLHPNPYHENSKTKWTKVINEVRNRLSSDINDHLKIVEFYRIVALLADQHSRIAMSLGGNHRNTSFQFPEEYSLKYPFQAEIFEDGLFITKAQNTDLLGIQIIEINNYSINTILDKLRPYLPIENEAGFIGMGPLFLTRPMFLQTIEVIKEIKEPIEITYQRENGTIGSQMINPMLENELKSFFEWQERNHKDLISIPEYLKSTPSLSVKIIEKMLIVSIKSIQNSEIISMKELAQHVDEILEQHKPSEENPNGGIDKVIIDIRENRGGNNYLNQWLVRVLIKHSWIDYPGRLFVLINRWTFSAAINLATELERYTWALFVGEPFSGRVNHYGDTELIELPYSGLNVRISTVYWQDSDDRDTRASIFPDIYVSPTFKEYKARIDIGLNKIKEYQVDESWFAFYEEYSPRFKWHRQSQKQKIEHYFSK